MSYEKYVEYKKRIKAEVSLEAYNAHVRELIEKKVEEGCRLVDLICVEKVNNLVEAAFYPRSEALKVAVFKGFIGIEKHLESLKDLNDKEESKARNELIRMLEYAQVANHLLASDEDIEDSVASHEEFYSDKLHFLARVVESTLKKIKWKNHLVEVHGIPIANKLHMDRAMLKVNEKDSIRINIENRTGRVLEDSRYYEECSLLLDCIKNTGGKLMSTFYIESSDQNKLLLKKMKEDLALGFKGYLPEGVILKDSPEVSAWRVRIEGSNLMPMRGQYVVGPNGAQVKFLEKL